MITKVDITPVRTYATRKNAEKAVEKLLYHGAPERNLRYFIHTTDNGRFCPVFIGESAVQAGIHFHFNVIG